MGKSNFRLTHPDLQDLIKYRRMELGMTLKYLAPRVGTTYVTLGNWERGYHMPKFDNLIDIARELQFEVKFFDKESGEEITFKHGNDSN